MFPISVDHLIQLGTPNPLVPTRGDTDKDVVWKTRDTSDLKTETVKGSFKIDGRVYRYLSYVREWRP